MTRRLLMAGGGSGGVVLPAAFTIQASGGMVSTANDPTAVYDPTSGKVFFAYTSGAGDVTVASVDTGGTVVKSVLATGGEVHANPSLILRQSDRRILAVWALHDAATPYIAVSTNPADASAFGTPLALHAQLGATADYTYMSLFQLAGDSGKLLLLWRDYNGVGRIAYSTSTDGGSTWATRTLLMTASGAGNVIYYRAGSDWDTRVDLVHTDTDRSDGNPSSLFHQYYEAGAWHTSDGTTITATKPYAPSEGTLIKNAAAGPCGPNGVAYDSLGRPACVFMVRAGGTNTVYSGRYRSGSWQVDSIVGTNGYPANGTVFHGAPSMDHADPDTVYVGRKTGSFYEAFRYTTPDDGATWTGTQLASGSAADALDIEAVWFASSIRAIAARGTWTNDSTFTAGTEGYR